MDMIFFFLFALVLVGMYISLRRQLAGAVVIAGGGVLGSIITMTLFMAARGAGVVQAIILGILVGALFAGATLAIAWYFHSNDVRASYHEEPILTPEE